MIDSLLRHDNSVAIAGLNYAIGALSLGAAYTYQ